MRDEYDFSKGIRGKYAEKACILVEHQNVNSACEFLKINKIEYKFERSYTNEICDGIKFIFDKSYEKDFIEAIYKPVKEVEEFRRGI